MERAVEGKASRGECGFPAEAGHTGILRRRRTPVPWSNAERRSFARVPAVVATILTAAAAAVAAAARATTATTNPHTPAGTPPHRYSASLAVLPLPDGFAPACRRAIRSIRTVLRRCFRSCAEQG